MITETGYVFILLFYVSRNQKRPVLVLSVLFNNAGSWREDREAYSGLLTKATSNK